MNIHVGKPEHLCGHTWAISVNSSYLQVGIPLESQIPPEITQNTKNLKKCIKFTPRLCDPPEHGV